MGYRPYNMMRDRIARLLAVDVPKKVWKADRNGYMGYVIRQMLSGPNMLQTMDASIIADEESYVNDGCRMVFPETPALLEMLWRAKMEVNLDDFDMSRVPRIFSIAWPDCKIDGVEMQGCLVAIDNTAHRREEIKKFGMKYFNYPLGLVNAGNTDDDELGVHISYFDGEGAMGTPMPFAYRVALPNAFLKACLKSEGDFESFIGSFKNLGIVGVLDMSDEEKHQQFVISKMVVHLLVYMQACYESLRFGYPTPKGDRCYRSSFSGDVHGSVIGVPDALKGEHASPSTHWRTWHFRSYPMRKDGSKRKGIVAVKGTIVNAEVDPVTAEAR